MLAGRLQINLSHQAGVATQVTIHSSRPDAATRVLLGKTPEQVLHTVPLLFSLCGNAQAYAALQACRSALHMPVGAGVDAAQTLLLQVETLREHAWRILLDWPGYIGLSPDKASVAALLKYDSLFTQNLFKNADAFKLHSLMDADLDRLHQLTHQLEMLIDTAVFNGNCDSFVNLDSEQALRNWLVQTKSLPALFLKFIYDQNWSASGQCAIACLPELPADALLDQMQQIGLADFVRTPSWLGHCYESTVLNRQIHHPLLIELSKQVGNGLLVRLLARLIEVASIPMVMRQCLAQISAKSGLPVTDVNDDGMGLSQVQAARGLLIHRLELRQGKVYDYRIVAPTEWNFHPEGVVAQSLCQLQASCESQLQQQANLLINAIDPCVQYQLTTSQQ